MNTGDIDTYQELLKRRQPQYERVLNTIRHKLDDYSKFHPEGKRAIYRVASRAAYQDGQEFKSPESVAKKIQQKRISRPEYSLNDVEDIVGLRVVCVYPSDIEIVAKYIRGLAGNELSIISDQKKDYQSGYTGHHFVVSLIDPALNDIKCEVQVVTMLFEAWAYKTHPLTYKGIEKNEEHERHAQLLADALRVADEHSEFLKLLIMRKRELDERRKNAARIHFASRIIPGDPIQEDVSSTKETEKLVDYILESEANLRSGDVSEILSRIQVCKTQYGITPGLVRATVLLASLRETNDLDWLALDMAQGLVMVSQDKDKGRAHRLKSLVCFCCGKLEDAIRESEFSLRNAEANGDVELAHLARNNIAYFIADVGDSGREEYARECIGKVIQEDKRPEFLDTYGYVLISFGKTPEEIEEGLSFCSKACAQDSSPEVGQRFLDIHKKKAYERMLEILQ